MAAVFGGKNSNDTRAGGERVAAAVVRGSAI
jgi:hypothetical protein